jgi:MFS transporter, FHS family, glucose/mannose:H+ symporter
MRALMVLGLLTFLHIGGLQAAYGPSFAALQARYGVSVAAVGTSVSAHFFGAFLGTLLAGVAVARFGYRPLLVAASVLMALGSLAIALAPTWSLALLGAALIGFGYGFAVVLYNFLFARAFASRGVAAVNLINGTFGIGAMLAPALVGLTTAVLAAREGAPVGLVTPLVFGGSALLGVSAAVVAARVPWLPPALRRPGAGGGSRLPLATLTLFAALFFVYIAVEVSTTAWAPTHVAASVGPARGALAASVFWVAMTAGRFLAAAIAARVRPADLVLASVALALAGTLVAHLSGLELVGYAVVGLGLAPIFPTSIAWVQRRFGPRAEQVAPVVIASGSMGPVLGAPAVGVAVAAAGANAVPSALALVMLVLAALVLIAWLTNRSGAAARDA